MRAYWKYHVDGEHRLKREDNPDHYTSCSWCDPTQFKWEEVPGTRVYLSGGTYTCDERKVYYDVQVEVMHMPQSAAADPIGYYFANRGNA